MRFPWQRETRDDSYTELVISAVVSGASGEIVRQATAAAELCAGWWGRAFALAEVTPKNVATAALTPAIMGHIGRRLLLAGEAVMELRTDVDPVRLDPAGQWDISGGPDRTSWNYALTMSGPSTTTRTMSGERVLHLQYAFDPNTPWRGIGPLQGAGISAGLLAILETRLREEVSQPVGSVLPVPNVKTSGELQGDLRKLKGELTLVQSTAQGWDQGKGSAPTSDWQTKRLGANPPEALLRLRDSTARELVAAAGLPASALEEKDATGQREGFRQFLHLTIQPISHLIAPVLADVLDTPELSLSFDSLFASDLSGRARAFQSMVGGGLDVTKAAGLAGLMEAE